ncbi:MAG: hypothetical protein ACKOTZ_14460, partial [Chloroflexota bacterium]
MSGRRRPGGTPPLPADLELVLIDGNNLLHRVRGASDAAGVRWLLPYLRAWRSATARVVLVLDGHPDRGDTPRRSVTTGIEAVHAGHLDADTAIVRRVEARTFEERPRTLVVTDDRGLADRVRREGALVRRLDWFMTEIARSGGAGPAAGSAGAARATPAAPTDPGTPARPAPRPAGAPPGPGRTPPRPVGLGRGRGPAAGGAPPP